LLPRLDLKLKDATFIAFDTETTGLYPLASRLVEIGACRFHSSGERISVFEQLIDPEMPIPPGAQAVNRITDNMVRGQPTVDRVLPAFIDFLDGSENLLVAHNAPFDLEFIGLDMLRLGLALPEHVVFDTCVLAQALMPGLASYSLSSLAVLLGVASPQLHRALSDAELAGEVLLDLLRRNPRIQTLEDLARVTPPLAFENVRIYQTDPPAGFEGLKEAMEQRLVAEIIYTGGTRGAVPRKVTPLALLRYGGFVYLAAHCHLDGKEKMYRLDRIQSLRVLRP
jgi:DNA polymerase-3 subunit epsilon